MSYFIQNFNKTKLSYIVENDFSQVDIDEINEGFSQDKEFLYYRNGEFIKIYDRVCDHNGGRLSLRGEKSICPLHGWELDTKSGKYLTARCSKKPLLEINEYELDAPYIDVPHTKETLKTQNFDAKKETIVRFLNHACLHFTIDDDFSFATDPWVIGSAFCTGWWLAKESPSDVFEVLNECDFIYISHNHPDHLHPESLKHIRKNMPILTAEFLSNSTSVILKDLGFTDITSMDFTSSFVDEDRQLSLSVLKSGDFRDDSGLLIENGEFKSLLTVDSNFINFGKLPSIDLLCSSFAGGASGFPLCFENYSAEERKKVITRNREAIKATNIKNIKLTSSRYFMPYAGFFSEKAKRDQYIKEHNTKNSVEDYHSACVANQCCLLNVNENQIFTFEGGELKTNKADQTHPFSNKFVDDSVKPSEISTDIFTKIVLTYFEGSNFQDDLVIDLITTDDSFENFKERFEINFNENKISCTDVCETCKKLEELALSNGNRFLQIKVRREQLLDVVLNRKPWEDLSIGFQCRIYRKPNEYNSEFWFYFTNHYIGSNAVDCSGLL